MSENEASIVKSLGLRLKEKLQLLTARERVLGVCAIAILGSFAGYSVYGQIRSIYDGQETRLAASQRNLDLAAAALSRYGKLRGRQLAIEENFKSTAARDNVLSQLETMLRDKAGISSGVTIKDKQVKTFGGSYEQTPYTVRFVTVDFPRLLDFLKELTQGEKPLILASLSLKPRPAGDSLEVEMEVSSIRRVKEEKNA